MWFTIGNQNWLELEKTFEANVSMVAKIISITNLKVLH